MTLRPKLTENQQNTAVSLNTLWQGSVTILLGIVLGAFAAHALAATLTPKGLSTFQTGVTYQIYHGLALLVLGTLQFLFPQNKKFSKVKIFFQIGILLFSFNCYLYAITQVAFFAHLVPFGGVSFIIGWSLLTWSIFQKHRQITKNP